LSEIEFLKGVEGDEPENSIVTDLINAAKAFKEKGKVVVLIEGKELYFRLPSSSQELRQFRADTLEFLLLTTKPDSMPAEWQKAVKGLPDADLVSAFALSFWSADPVKITVVEALHIIGIPSLADRLLLLLDREFTSGIQMTVLQKVDLEKKGLNPTPLDVPLSPFRRKSTANTRTNSRKNKKAT